MNEQLEKYFAGFERHLRILQALSEKSVKSYREKVEEFFRWKKNNPLNPPLVRGTNPLLHPSQEGNNPPPISPPVGAGSNITRQDVEGYLEWCFYRGNGNSTRFTKLIALQKFFRYLVYDGIIKEDVTAMIPRPRIFKKFVQKFTKNEVLEFFRAIDILTEQGLRDATVFILAAFCGLRVNEIVKLTLNDIVDEEGFITVNIPETKHKSSRSVYLWKVPSVLIRKWFTIRMTQGAKADDPLLIQYYKSGRPRDGFEGLSAVSIHKIAKKYAQKAGIRKPRVHVHMFRATHASDLRYIKGYDIAAIAERLGHKDISSTDRYLPSRERIHREYRSLAEYWYEFATIWTKKEEKEDGNGKKTNPNLHPGAAAHTDATRFVPAGAQEHV